MSSIAVFGAGNIGCYVGGRLAAAGGDVVLVGRPRVLDPLAGTGLTLSDYRGYHEHLPPSRLRLSTDPAAAGGAGLVLVTVKSAATAEAARELRPLLQPDAVVVSLQNGLRNAGVLAAALPGHTVLAGMVPFNVVHHAAAHYHQGSEGGLMAADHPALRHVRTLFARAGLPLQLRRDMPAVLWAKLLLNLNNAVNALSGLPLKTELDERDFRRVLAAAQREAITLLKSHGQTLARLTPLPPAWMPALLEVPDAVFRIAAARMLAIDPLARSSMWEDLEAGRGTEVDFINGEVVALATARGRRAPVNALLVRLVHAAEQGGRRSWTAAELLAQVRHAIG